MSRPPEPTEPRRPATLLSLPPELHLLIALHLYSPLHLTQQDRLTWSVFSTVDMDPERWQGMDGLIAFAGTCKTVRRTVRYLLFRCVRVHGLREGRWMIRAATASNKCDSMTRRNASPAELEKRPTAVGDDWGKYVHSVILDMAMFDPDQQQVQLDEHGRRSEDRGEYDADMESRRAIQSRIANWTTSVQNYLPGHSNEDGSPFTNLGEGQPAIQQNSTGKLADLARGAGPSEGDPLRGDRLENDVDVGSQGSGTGSSTQGNPTTGTDKERINPGTTREEDSERAANRERVGGEEEEDEEDEEEEWESFPLTPPRVRDPWKEASFLITMLTRLPCLHHLSIFADPSDDLTLSLLFSNPAMLAIAPRLRSFGWRLRASPPSALREFDNSTMYVSVQGWLKECTSLGFLVLDSDIEAEGVREVDLERVVKCLGEGRERTVRRREREMRNEAKVVKLQHDRYQGMLAGGKSGGKRKYGTVNTEGGNEAVKRQKSESTEVEQYLIPSKQLVSHAPPSKEPIRRRLAMPGTSNRIGPTSNLSLMLCGPIQGWILSPEAELWAAENMDDLRTWMSETKSALMTASASAAAAPASGAFGRRDTGVLMESDEVSRAMSGSTISRRGNDRMAVPSGSGPLLSPVSVLSSSYSPAIPMSNAAGGNNYFAHHHHHQEMQTIQPYIHDISHTPYQPQFSGIVPSYAHLGPHFNSSASAGAPPMGYAARPALRSHHSRSYTPLSDTERRKAALENRPPVFLDGIVADFTGIKELFIDRPVRAPYGTEEDTLMLLTIAMLPLIHLPHLTLLQIGGYPLSPSNQLIATDLIVALCPQILLCGWLGLEGETNWYGVWRDRGTGEGKAGKKTVKVQDYWGRGVVERCWYELKPLGDGDLFELEEAQQAAMMAVV